MKKTYSKAQLEEKAQSVFEQYPNEKRVFATVDGNIFLSENFAYMHAGAKGTVYPFDREVPVESADQGSTTTEGTKKIEYKEALSLIAEAETVEELEALGLAEDTRKTVVAAYDKRKTELEAAPVITLIDNAVTIEELEALGFDQDSREVVKTAYEQKKEALTGENK